MAGLKIGFSRTTCSHHKQIRKTRAAGLLRRSSVACAGSNGSRFGLQPRAPRTSSSSNSSEGAVLSMRAQPAIPARRAKRAQRRAGEASNLALHVVVNVVVVADSRKIPQCKRVVTPTIRAPRINLPRVHPRDKSCKPAAVTYRPFPRRRRSWPATPKNRPDAASSPVTDFRSISRTMMQYGSFSALCTHPEISSSDPAADIVSVALKNKLLIVGFCIGQ